MRQVYTLLLLLSFTLIIVSDIHANDDPPCDAVILTPDQTEVCDNFFMVSAQEPEGSESGLWTGPGNTSFVDENDPGTFITNLNPGPNIITWTIFDANGIPCSSTSITLINNEVTTTPIITTENNLEVCDENGFQLAANPITELNPGEEGSWSANNASVTFSPNINDPNAIANGLVPGNNIIFWNIRKEGCSANPASITVTNNEVITEPEIEPFSVLISCETNGFENLFANLTNQLIPGETGTWSGPPGVTFSPNSESPTISGLLPGENILTWTITRGNCPPKATSVTLTNNMVMTDAQIFTSAQEVCDENNFTIEGNQPADGETGTWSGPPGVAFTDPNSPTTTINGLQPGDNEICWTISRGDCPPTQACVTITNNEVTTTSTISTADGQEVCGENGFEVMANTPADGETGTWSGPVGVTFVPDANSPNATVNGLPSGTSTLCWTITRGGCDDTATELCIEVTNNEVNTTAAISTQSGQEVCDENGFMVSANAPANGETGTWSGPAGVTFVPDANSPDATVNNLPPGTSTLCWTITRGGCDDTSTEACIEVTNNEVNTESSISTASGQEVCDENGFEVMANTPADGETGTWSGPAGVTFMPNANSPNATVNGLPSGTSTLCWTITRGGCDDTATEACIEVTNNEVNTTAAISTQSGQEVCDENGFMVSANAPANGETGTWSGPAGVTFVPDANSPDATVNNLPPGTSTLCWTITRGGCDDTSTEACIEVTNNEVNTESSISTASGQEVCDENGFEVMANTPADGETGTWSGPAGVTFMPNANSPNATVNGLPSGTSTLCWTITRGGCDDTATESCIEVTNNEVNTTAAISTQSGQEVCDENGFMVSANAPANGETGTWSGPAGVTFVPDANSPDATVNNLPPGTSTLCWTITRGGCEDTSTEACIEVTNNEVNTESSISTAGGQEVCDENGFEVMANTPADGETGTWSGPAGVTFVPNANSPNATVNNLPPGTSTLCWTITRGGCDDTATESCIEVTNNEVNTTAAISTQSGQEVCDENGFMVSANAPANGETGTWSGPAGVTFVPNANSPDATVNGLPSGTSTLCWTITRGGCEDTATEACIEVTNNEVNTESVIATSSGQEICDENGFELMANTPADGETGTWSGPAGVTFVPNANSPNATVNNLPPGTSTLCWTITRGGCDDTATESCIEVTNNEVNTTAAISTQSGQEVCDENGFMVSANAPANGETGTWSGPAGVTFVPNANSPNATVNGLPSGTSTLCWTITRGGCEDTATEACIEVTNNEVNTESVISTADGQEICDENGFEVSANTPADGETGTWSGPAGVTFAPNANSPNATANNLPPGTSTLCWTITRGGCDDTATESCIEVTNNEVTTVSAIATASGQEVCNEDNFAANGNVPADGETGTWSGPPGVTFSPNANAPSVVVNGLPTGTSTLCWTITRGGCEDTTSESCIEVINNEVLTQAAVATASGQETCDSDTFIVEGNAPQGNETGTWSGPAGVTFDPDANSPTATVIGLPLGTSTLIWTISNGSCPATSAEITILNNEPTQPEISTSGGQAICDIESFTLEANTPATGETGVWTGPAGVIYLPNINSPTVTVSNLPPGDNDFTWTITQGGCSLSDVVTVTTYSTPVSTTTISDVTIVDGNDGEIAICINGGTSPYDVTWEPNEGDLAPVGGPCDANYEITGLTENIYTIYIQDANGCADTIPNVAVSGPVCDDFNIGLVTEVGETCNDTQDGSITIEVLGAQGDITYSIGNGIPDVVTSDNPYTFTDLPAGSYNLFVQDERLCPDSYISNPVIVTEPNPLTVSTSVTDLSVIGGSDGAVCITVEGGTAPYTVTSDCGTVVTGAGSCGGDFHIPNLADLTCEITIVDATGECTVMTSATVSPPTCDLSINGDPIVSEVNCFNGNDGSITVNASSMGGGIQYSIDGGDNFMTGASPFTFDNLPAGTYNLVLEDALNCTTSYSNNPIVLNNPMELLVTTDTIRTSTVGGNDGIIDICINGGTPNFTVEYSPNTGFLTSVSGNCDANFQILGLIEGEYQITVTDANGCVFNITETVEGPDCSSFTIGQVLTENESCDESDDGSITIEVLGAIGEIIYSVGNGVPDVTTNTNPYTFENLPEGEYIVFVVDQVGCSNSYISNPVTITAPEPLSLGATLTNVSVLGGSDGVIEVSATGGTGPFTATIDGGSQMTSADGNFTFSGLSAGTYEIIITDANGCEITTTQTLNDPSCVLEVTNVTTTAASCSGFSDGTLTVTATSDNPPIMYTIDGVNFQSSNVFTDLPAGEYTVGISDAVACTASFSGNPVVVSEPPALDVLPTILGVTTLGGSNGRVILCLNGGTPDYTVTIDPPSGTVTETMGSCDADFEITDLPPNDYTITITDANGCEVLINALIEEPDCDDFAVEAVNPMDNSCNVSSQSNPDPDGTVEIIVTGGEPPYDYSIFGGANPINFADTSYLFTGLNVGTYTILVTDASGCAVGWAETIEIGEPELLVSPPTVIEPSVVGGSDGEICLSPSGGIPPYIVTASCGTVIEGAGPQCGGDFYITGLMAGQCDILVVDANLCEASGTIILEDPPCDQFGISAVSSNDACFGVADGEITINIMGGTPPYLYSVDGGTTTESSSDMSFTFTGLPAGAYDLFVSDMVLCTEDYADQIVIAELPEFEVDAGDAITVEIGESIDLNATSNETGTYEWTPADGLDDPFSATPTLTPTDIGDLTYQVTLTTAEGCTATDELTVTVEDNSTVVVPGGFTPNGDGNNDTFFPVINGNVDVLSFTVWNRWGEKIYDNPAPPGWDGTYKGVKQPLSTFVYMLEYSVNNKPPEFLKGDVVLIR